MTSETYSLRSGKYAAPRDFPPEGQNPSLDALLQRAYQRGRAQTRLPRFEKPLYEGARKSTLYTTPSVVEQHSLTLADDELITQAEWKGEFDAQNIEIDALQYATKTPMFVRQAPPGVLDNAIAKLSTVNEHNLRAVLNELEEDKRFQLWLMGAFDPD